MKPPLPNEVRKPTKTLSGVTPIAVMVEPRACAHGTCTYCPQLNVPQSYTPISPPVIRAKILNYQPVEQVKSRLKAYTLMHHPTDKIELIIMGGTFLAYPTNYQYKFIKKCYDALNEKPSKTLEQAKKINETAKHRCIALCIETRPDFASEKDLKRALEFGCTRIELGVQAIDDKIYKKVNRGHTVKDVIDATQRIKNFGFKLGYHIMPGLPGSNSKKDIQMFKKIFSNQNFKPDQIKIYPTQVIKGSQLEKDFQKGLFKPYSQEQTYEILKKMIKLIPRYCRAMRIMRELAPDYIIAGTTRISLRKDVEEDLRKESAKIKEIRFREIGFALQNKIKISKAIKIKTTIYQASNGKEYFIEAVNKDDILFGLLRLRIPNKKEKSPVKELNGSAIVRELHVYGQTLNIGEKSESQEAIQHKGMGKLLMAQAEKITKQQKIKKIAVISGIGVRDYYKKLGYVLEGSYMIKEI
ncbi:MAG: tRNA uridine(34) 5-carboxymethylaminomethyl modification radical SAM/GNAT enzyme Elp3 [Candidatus Pacearchaeota archaeon]|jgi:elongator complex protein 3